MYKTFAKNSIKLEIWVSKFAKPKITSNTFFYFHSFDKLVETTTILKGLESCCTYKYDQSSISMNETFFFSFVDIQSIILEFELRKQRCVNIGVIGLNNSQEYTEDLTFNSNVKEYVNNHE